MKRHWDVLRIGPFEREFSMYLSRPTQVVFVISVLLAIAALLIFLNVLQFAAIPSFWIMTAAFVLLLLGNLVKGL